MKKLSAIISICFLSLLSVSHAQSGNDLVRAEVRLQTETDRKDIKNSTADTKTQRVALNISLSGKPKSPETRKLKWYIFGKNVQTNRITVLESDESALSLDNHGQQVIETRTATTTSTPDHSVVSRSRSSGRNRQTNVSAKRVEGSGVKYFGYGVRIQDGANVVGKVFSSQSLEAEAK